MPLLRSIFTPQPTPPPTVDTADLAKLSTDELQSRLSDVARQRRVVVEEHAARVQPLVEERARLEQEIGAIDSKLAWEGVQRTDTERALDRLVQAAQAELHARVEVVDAEDVDVLGDADQRQVERVLSRLKSGKLARNNFIASSEVEIQAQLEYDRLVESLRAFARQAVQTRHVSGHMPEKPAEAKGFHNSVFTEICRREGLQI